MLVILTRVCLAPRCAQEHDGYCGVHKCTGPRDRCLLVDRQEEDYRAKKRGECPKGCWKNCKKTTHRLECVYIGGEPPHGNEGDEVPKGLYEEPLKYEVYSLRAPVAAALLGAPQTAAAARGARAGARRTRAWSGFLG
ncbi:unnamed protein product [Prorocentrum cordatum]|uniref:Uncharacterized protein n=1 Tax=Prorocentrum cordatum TaxID=2364126 RepID=A0ABN9TXX2_9DINO|nr:unnamed protein product [Polarella glacialis]